MVFASPFSSSPFSYNANPSLTTSNTNVPQAQKPKAATTPEAPTNETPNATAPDISELTALQKPAVFKGPGNAISLLAPPKTSAPQTIYGGRGGHVISSPTSINSPPATLGSGSSGATSQATTTTPAATGPNELPGWIASELESGKISSYTNPNTHQTFYGPGVLGGAQEFQKSPFNQSGIFVSGPTGAGPISGTVGGAPIRITGETVTGANGQPINEMPPETPQVDYTVFGKGAFINSSPQSNAFSVSEDIAGNTWKFSGTVPTTVENNEVAKNNAIVDMAWQGYLNTIQSNPNLAKKNEGIFNINLDNPTESTYSSAEGVSHKTSPMVGTMAGSSAVGSGTTLPNAGTYMLPSYNPVTGTFTSNIGTGSTTLASATPLATSPTYTYLGTTQPSSAVAPSLPSLPLSYAAPNNVVQARDLTASNLGGLGPLYLQSAVPNNGKNIGLSSLPIQTAGNNQSLNTTSTSSNQPFFLLNPNFYANLPQGFANTLGNIAHWAYPYQSGGQPTAGGQFPYNYPRSITDINSLSSSSPLGLSSYGARSGIPGIQPQPMDYTKSIPVNTQGIVLPSSNNVIANAINSQYQQLLNAQSHVYPQTMTNAAYQYLGSPSASGDVFNYIYTPHQFELAAALATPSIGIDAVGLPVVAGSTAIGAGSGGVINPLLDYYLGGVTNPAALANAAAQGTVYGGYVGAVMPGAESVLSNVPGMSATEGTLGKIATLNRGAITGLGVQNLYSYLTTGQPASPTSDIFGIATGAAVPTVLESPYLQMAAAKLSGTDIASKMTISDYVDTYGTKEMPIIQDFLDTIKRFGGNPDNAYLIVNQKTGSIITPYYQDVHLGYAKAADIYSYLREVSANNQGKINLATTSGAALPNEFTVESQSPTYNVGEPGVNAETGQALRGVRKYAYGPEEGMYFNVPTIGGRSIQLNYAPEIAPVSGSATEPKTVFRLNPFGTKATFLTTTTNLGNIDVASLDEFQAETGVDPNTPAGKVAFSKWLADKATSAGKEFYFPYQNYFPGTDEIQAVKTVGSAIDALDSHRALIITSGEGEPLKAVFTKLITAQSTGEPLTDTLESLTPKQQQALTDAYREASLQASTPVRYSTITPSLITPTSYATPSSTVTYPSMSAAPMLSSSAVPATSSTPSLVTSPTVSTTPTTSSISPSTSSSPSLPTISGVPSLPIPIASTTPSVPSTSSPSVTASPSASVSPTASATPSSVPYMSPGVSGYPYSISVSPSSTSPIGSYPFPSYPTSPSLSPLSYSGYPYPDYRRRSLAYPYPYPAIVGSDWYTNELATNPKLRPKYVSRYSPSLLPLILPGIERLAERSYSPLTETTSFRPIRRPVGRKNTVEYGA